MVVRNTFLQVVPGGIGGDASWRSSRSAGPRPKADQLPIILEELLPADEPSAFATIPDLAADVLSEATPTDEFWFSWACPSFSHEEVWYDVPQDLWGLVDAPSDAPNLVEFDFAEDEDKPLAGSTSPEPGSYLAALLKHVDAPSSPGGACVQSAAGGRRLSRPRAALDEAAFVPKAPLASGTTSAEKRSERPNMLDGDTKGRRRGKRGGQKRRDAAALRTKLLA